MDTLTAPAATTTTKKSRRGFSFYRNSTFVALLVGYAGYYLCRQNLSVAYAPMRDALGIDLVAFGAISSTGTLFYALGKLTTGALADTRGGRSVFFLGLAGSALASLVFGLGAGLGFFVTLWSVNRVFQSMGWGGLVNVMSRWFPKSSYGTAMGIMSVNYQFGGVVASVYAGALLSLGFGWKALFVVPALTLATIGLVLRPLLVNSPRDVGFELPPDEENGNDTASATASVPEAQAAEPVGYLGAFRTVLSDRMFWIMCGLSFILTLLRECFNTWMPAYFSGLGEQAHTAAFKSAVFPLLGCVGTLFAGWYSDRYLQGRRGPVMAVLLVGLVACLVGLMKVEDCARWLGTTPGGAALPLVGLTGFFLLGPYSLVGGVAALDFGGRRTAGTAAGLLDGVGYLGATLAGIGVAQLVVTRGWTAAFGLMAILTGVALGLCGLLWGTRPR